MSAAEGLVVDLFAGGGGASTGLARALGRIDIAIDHDPRAIAMHMANHPDARHYHCDVWEVDPREATDGKPVAVLWASPDCTFFSKARGSKPHRDRRFANRRRALATVVTRWAKEVRPRVILIENVEEFARWGPLDADGLPIKHKAGASFRRWVSRLRNLGYLVDWQNLAACDYGAPTSRKRLFIVARRDGNEIRWPTPSHGPGTVRPYRTAASIVDWSKEAPSIFGQAKLPPEATCRRIARGVVEKVITDPNPYIVDRSHTLITVGFGERKGQAPRVPGLEKPFGTICAQGNKHALVTAFMVRHWGGMVGNRLDGRPWPTVTTKGCQDQICELHLDRRGEVRAFLDKYYGTGVPASVKAPCPTVICNHHLGLVTVAGVEHQITDIGMRMLTPRELFAAQGFATDYQIDVPVNVRQSVGSSVSGKRLGVTDQRFLAGNSVCPDVAEALVRANVEGR